MSEKLALPSNEEIRAVDIGIRKIWGRSDLNLANQGDMKEVSDAYTKLVQDNPEYVFELGEDIDNRAVTIRWKRLT